MTINEFCDLHGACNDGRQWALANCADMADVWRKLCAGEGENDWLLWLCHKALPESTRRRLACRFIRETPLTDGRTVWDLLTDVRSRTAVETAERYADGPATGGELAAAVDAAYAADAAYADAYAAADAAAAAADAQRLIVSELFNPFEQEG